METALYHPEHGYYRRPRDPFGREGDFYTAEQVQPVFGRLIRRLFELEEVKGTVVELGAGREEMREHLGGWEYCAVDVGRSVVPERFSGAIFGNEFLDALPVDVIRRTGDRCLHVRVGVAGDDFAWVDAEPASDGHLTLVESGAGMLDDGARIEVCPSLPAWIERIASCLECGLALFIDYGYTRRESVRFPEGTLMGYHRHLAHDDVLRDPGERDITAHVAWSAVEHEASRNGLAADRLENMATLLLRAGERDEFASALAAPDEREAQRLRMQLKTLLFGMGESFRALTLRKE